VTALFALPPIALWGIEEWLIGLLIFGGVVAVFYLIWTQALGYTIPPWLPRVLWVLVAVVVGIFAIRFLLAL
jgi:hypothetical protein